MKNAYHILAVSIMLTVGTFIYAAHADEPRRYLEWREVGFVPFESVMRVRTPYGDLKCQMHTLSPLGWKGVAAGEVLIDYSDGYTLSQCKSALTDYYFKHMKPKGK